LSDGFLKSGIIGKNDGNQKRGKTAINGITKRRPFETSVVAKLFSPMNRPCRHPKNRRHVKIYFPKITLCYNRLLTMIELYAPTVAREVPVKIERWNSFSYEPSESSPTSD